MNWSHFIHEELFELKPKVGTEQKYTLGICVQDRSAKEDELLSAILGAIKVDISSICFAANPNNSSDFWIRFGGDERDYFETKQSEYGKVICSPPLAVLLESKEYKGQLWQILKTHFDI